MGPPVNDGNAFTAATGIQRDIESVVWTLEDGFLSRSLHLNWINPDGQTARGTAAVYVPSADAFAVTGDVNLFMEAFGPAHEVVRFCFVSYGAEDYGIMLTGVRYRRSTSSSCESACGSLDIAKTYIENHWHAATRTISDLASRHSAFTFTLHEHIFFSPLRMSMLSNWSSSHSH